MKSMEEYEALNVADLRKEAAALGLEDMGTAQKKTVLRAIKKEFFAEREPVENSGTFQTVYCPFCGSKNLEKKRGKNELHEFRCRDCGRKFQQKLVRVEL